MEPKMTALKATFKFQQYKGILPYASELFGVYQPLLGWKSKRSQRRFALRFNVDQLETIEQLSADVASQLTIETQLNSIHLKEFKPGGLLANIPGSRSLLVTAI